MSSAAAQRTIERPLVRDIVDQQDAHSAAVICCRYRPEALLARGVPLQLLNESLHPGSVVCAAYNLQLDAPPIEFNGANLEVDTDGGYERRRPCVVTEPQEETRLADARVSDEE